MPQGHRATPVAAAYPSGPARTVALMPPLAHVAGAETRLRILDYSDATVSNDHICCICMNPMTAAMRCTACPHHICQTCAPLYPHQCPLCRRHVVWRADSALSARVIEAVRAVLIIEAVERLQSTMPHVAHAALDIIAAFHFDPRRLTLHLPSAAADAADANALGSSRDALAFPAEAVFDCSRAAYLALHPHPASVQLLRVHDTAFVDLAPLHVFTSLQQLQLQRCEALESLTGTQLTDTLASLALDACAACSLDGLAIAFPVLTALHVVHNPLLQSLEDVAAVATLTSLFLEDCATLKSLSSLLPLKGLTTVCIRRCALRSLDGLQGSAAALREVEVCQCPWLSEINALSTASQLHRVVLESLRNLNLLALTAASGSLTELDLKGSWSMLNQAALPALPRLNSLRLCGGPYVSISVLFPTLPWLTHFELSNSKCVECLAGLAAATRLQTLRISNCPEAAEVLQDLPALSLPQLRVLDFSGNESLTRVPSFVATLAHLETVDLSGTDVRGVEALRRSAATLRVVRLADCHALSDVAALVSATNMEELSLRGTDVTDTTVPLLLQSRLRKLDLTRCSQLTQLPALNGASELVELRLAHLRVGSLKMLSGCCERLEVLDVSGCVWVRGLTELRTHTKLREVILDGTGVRSLVGLEASANTLERLSARGCVELGEVGVLNAATRLRSVHLADTPVRRLDWLSSAAVASLEELDMGDCRGLNNISCLSSATKLRRVVLRGTSIGDIAALKATLTVLEHVDVCDCPAITQLDVLFKARHLEVLLATGTSLTSSATLLTLLPAVREVTLSGDVDYTMFPIVSLPESMRRLGIRRRHMRSLNALRGKLNLLTAVDLSGCTALSDISALSSIGQSLTEVRLDDTAVASLAALTSCSCGLQIISITRCRSVDNLDPLSRCGLLKEVRAAETAIISLEPLRESVPHLEVLDVRDCRNLKTIQPLVGAKSLRHLDVTGTRITDWEEAVVCAAGIEHLAAPLLFREETLRGLVNRGLLHTLRAPAQPRLAPKQLSLCAPALLSDLSSSLRAVDFSNHINMHDFAALSCAARLEEVRLDYTAIEHVRFLRACCFTLQRLSLQGCRRLLDLDDLLPHTRIRELRLNGTDVSDVSALRNSAHTLEYLDCTSNYKLCDITHLAGATLLRTVLLSYTTVTDISALCGSAESLETVHLGSCPISDIDPLREAPRLRDIDLNSTEIDSLAALSRSAASLQRVDVSNCPNLFDVTPLTEALNLRRVLLDNLRVRRKYRLHAHWPHLEVFHASMREMRQTFLPLSFLHSCHALTELHLDHLCLRSLDVLRGSAAALQVVHITSCPKLAHIDALCESSNLREVSVAKTGISCVVALRTSASALEMVDLRECSNLTDLTPLEGCTRLSTVLLDKTDVDSIAALQGSASTLRVVSLSGCRRIANLSDLTSATRLQRVNIDHTPVSSLGPLRHSWGSLESVSMHGFATATRFFHLSAASMRDLTTRLASSWSPSGWGS